jgi:hypothetical protein
MRRSFKALLRVVNLLICLFMTMLLAVFVAFLFYAPAVVLPALFDDPGASHHFLLPIPFPPWLWSFPIQLTPAGESVYFMFLVVSIGASFLWLLQNNGRKLLDQVVGTFEGGQLPRVRSPNAVLLVPQLFIAILFFNVAYIVALSMMGITTTTPEGLEEGKTWELMYALANASVYEELVCRVLYLGIPLGLWHRFSNLDNPEWHRYILGGRLDPATPPAVLLILFSSFVFGMAHMPGWDMWKVVPTFVSGLGFGYLFLKKGLYSAVLLHFFFDYLTIPGMVMGAWLDVLILGPVVLITLVCGLFYFLHFSFSALRVPLRWLDKTELPG